MPNTTDWQTAAEEFWRSVRSLMREQRLSAEEAEERVGQYRKLLQKHGVSEGLIFHRGPQAAAQAAVAQVGEVAVR
jgi:hypothetical protein